MDEWDDDKLAEVVSKKHGTEKSNETDIICKHFLDAVENNKYGWFWECPVGGKQCKYRHALPKGFLLKKDKAKKDKEEAGISIEDLIETERGNLDQSKLTKVTLQSFVAWKKKKDKKKKDLVSGQASGMSGRDMFLLDPSMISRHSGHDEGEEEGEEFDLNIREEEEDDGVKVHEIKFDEYGIMDDGVDDRTAAQEEAGGAAAAEVAVDEDLFDDDLEDLDEELDGAAAAEVTVDEDLFDDDP